MSNTKYDYDVLEREYVSGDMSLRELAKSHGMSHSLVMAASTKRKWADKRNEFQARAADRAVDFMADREAMRRVRGEEIRDNALEAIDEAIFKLRADMKATHLVQRNGEYVEEPHYRHRPQDIVVLIDRMQTLFGKPSQITEERTLGISVDAGRLGADTLKQFIDATRGLGPVGGGASESPLPRADRTREN